MHAGEPTRKIALLSKSKHNPRGAALVWALAMLGTFNWNAKLSAVSRLITYVFICAALPALRWKSPDLAKFHLPMGPLFAFIGIAFCGMVLSRAGRFEVLVLGVTLTIASLNWILVRHRSADGDHEVADATPIFMRSD